ncbi:MAG: type 4a pilus biogenesis protein PilO [Myxococcales bacterium]|nr:type 4a pilus biogenesis protein PilO [Myxococcales bacterium]MCB9522984.1 type 4a pilus biogenesis protein PilO [Myxococcales bacterium]
MEQLYDKLSALPAAQKAALLIMLMAAVGAGWYFLYYDETRTLIAKEKGQTDQLTKTLADEKEIEKNLAVYKAEIEELRAERDRMRDRLPDNAEIADLLEKIHGQAKITGLEIARFERKPTEVESMYARIPVKMELVGNFKEITTFFFYLGKLTRIVNVEDIQLATKSTTREEREKGTVLLASCTATTFMYVAEGGAAPGQKPQRKGAK